MHTVTSRKEQKNPREIMGEISRIVCAEDEEAAQTLHDIQFAPIRRLSSQIDESNWQLIIFPPASEAICVALDRAAAVVQRRWDMADMFQGVRPLLV